MTFKTTEHPEILGKTYLEYWFSNVGQFTSNLKQNDTLKMLDKYLFAICFLKRFLKWQITLWPI